MRQCTPTIAFRCCRARAPSPPHFHTRHQASKQVTKQTAICKHWRAANFQFGKRRNGPNGNGTRTHTCTDTHTHHSMRRWIAGQTVLVYSLCVGCFAVATLSSSAQIIEFFSFSFSLLLYMLSREDCRLALSCCCSAS